MPRTPRHHGRVPLLLIALVALVPLLTVFRPATAGADSVTPGATWATETPAEANLDPAKLQTLASVVGGNGVVVRYGKVAYTWGNPATSGDISSGAKPLLSAYMLKAVQDGLITGPDAKVSVFEPGLTSLNNGKDAGITWRHLASMTSGYGLSEAPGGAYGYNDYAIRLYYETLRKVYGNVTGNQMLTQTFATALGFQDSFSHSTSNGRLSLSPRDWARFGLLFLNGGKWGDTEILKQSLVGMATSSPVFTDIPRTSGTDAPMLAGQGTFGGSKNQTGKIPGFYSFNWWLNSNWKGEKLDAPLPADTYSADGHWGRRKLWVIPSQDLIVAWNGSGATSGDPEAFPNAAMVQATEAMRDMVLPDPPPEVPEPTIVEVPGPTVEKRVEVPGPTVEKLVPVLTPAAPTSQATPSFSVPAVTVVLPKTVRLSGQNVTFTVRNTSSAPVEGRVTFKRTAAGRTRTMGSKDVEIRAGKTKTVKLRLSASAARTIRSGSLTVGVALVAPAGGSVTTSAAVSRAR
jgi:CubicO group peptidase (beta-lactamase class C family)